MQRPMNAALTSTHRLVAFLGQGGNGVVYLAIAHGPEGVDKLVVLKALKGPVEARLHEQLMDEARVAVLLNHPNVIHTFGVTLQDHRPVLSMEFLDGHPLSRVLERAWQEPGAVPVSVWLRIARDALRGLHHAHELCALGGKHLGLVHRDLTPQNVFVTFSGGVKILDFGVAKTASSLLSTAPGHVKGSLRYMSPEQAQQQALDRRSDVFSMGVLLWEMLAGERLWRRSTDTSVMHALHGNDALRSPQTVNPAIPEELARITSKALALNRADRYGSAAELLADLEAHGGLASDAELVHVFGKLFEHNRLDIQALLARELLHAPSGAARLPDPLPSARPTASEASLAPLTSALHSEPPSTSSGGRAWFGIGIAALLLGWVVTSSLWAARATARASTVAPASPAAQPAPVGELRAVMPRAAARLNTAAPVSSAARGSHARPPAPRASGGVQNSPQNVPDFGGRR